MTRDKDAIHRDLMANTDKIRDLRSSGMSGDDWHAANLSIASEKESLLNEYQAVDPSADVSAGRAEAERDRSWSRRKLGLDD